MLFLIEIVSGTLCFQLGQCLLFFEQRQYVRTNVVFNCLSASLGEDFQLGALVSRKPESDRDFFFLFFRPPVEALAGVIDRHFSEELTDADFVLRAISQNQLLLFSAEIRVHVVLARQSAWFARRSRSSGPGFFARRRFFAGSQLLLNLS